MTDQDVDQWPTFKMDRQMKNNMFKKLTKGLDGLYLRTNLNISV